MKNYAIIGYPLGHSLSPLIHTMILEEAGINARYHLNAIPPETLAAAFEASLKQLDGFNVTIPHKVDIIPLLDYLDQRAALFGAVNAVKREGDTYTGYNTDCYGFLMALKRAGLPLQDRVLLCGSGGVARMIAFESVMAGCELTIATRESSVPEAMKLVEEIKVKLGKKADTCLLNEVQGAFDLIVNGTPVGMYPNMDGMPLPEAVVKLAGGVYDTVYNPRETLLVQTANKYGIPCAGGMDMLVCQAVKAQEIFNGIDPAGISVTPIVEACYQELEARA